MSINRFKLYGRLLLSMICLLSSVNLLTSQSELQDSTEVSDTYYEDILDKMLEASQQHIELKRQNFQQEIELLDIRNELLEQTQRNQRRSIWIGTIFFLVLSSLLYYLYYAKQKTNTKLRELDEIKARLFADISHEFRTPLSLIKGPIELLLSDDEMSVDTKEKLLRIHKNANKLNRLVNNVNDLTRLESQKMKLSVHQMDLDKHLRSIMASFQSFAQDKNLRLSIQASIQTGPYFYDPTHVESILYNLISNAIKYSEEGEVTLVVVAGQGSVEIQVCDTGIGLSTEEQSKVFDRYYRGQNSNPSDGIGLGLALSKQLALLHKGDLTVKSRAEQGTIFTLHFPSSINAYEKHELNVSTAYNPMVAPLPSYRKEPVPLKKPVIHEDEQVILLVEDHQDMHDHLKEVFQNDYRLIHAANGKEGFELATELIPDLIISDFKMPVMDGMQLLQNIRNDLKTSHIPFIILTANHEEQTKLEGLQKGVDAFMHKPFSVQEITLQVRSLIAMREKLKNKFQDGDLEQRPQEINDADRQFWKQLQEVVHANLDNSNFSAEDFSKAMYMSRMQLHRKLKVLTGHSAMIYLRGERLRAAKEILKNTNVVIANVAYDVGFSSPSFFSKCFKEAFGKSPKEYQNM